jgi:sterol-4alpha-carboxylate 3-dehydrogenase (decarboxylating)
MATKSLVTGGSGFTGRHLVDALVARGDEVTVVDMLPKPPREDVRYIEADICDQAAMRAACEGVDVVFHNASLVHTKRNQEARVWAVNFDGSKNVLAACQKARVKRLVYVSSASAVYEGRDIENGDERMPYSSISQAPYADSKIAAEKAILAASGEGGVLTCAIRPHVIFGPGDQRFLPAILERARSGRLKFAVGREVKYSDFTYISNLVDALLLADEKLTPGSGVAGQAYFVTNGEPMPFWEFVRRVLARFGLPPIRGTVPYLVAYAAAAAAEAIDTLKGGTLNAEDGMTRFAIKYMCTHHYFSIEKAKRDLGYRPGVSLEEGIDRTARHFEARGAL